MPSWLCFDMIKANAKENWIEYVYENFNFFYKTGFFKCCKFKCYFGSNVFTLNYVTKNVVSSNAVC